MKKKKEYVEAIPITEWPEQERRMAIIARMTSDPPINKQNKRISNFNKK